MAIKDVVYVIIYFNQHYEAILNDPRSLDKKLIEIVVNGGLNIA